MLLRWRLGGGSYRTLESDASPVFDARGEMLRLQGVDRGVTERIAAETELKRRRDHLEELVTARTAELSLAKEATEAASRAKSTFLATRSHELRTPMSATIGMTELALRKASDPKQQDYLGKVATASRQLLGLIDDIFDISRIEAERLSLEVAALVLLRFEVEDIGGGISDAELRRLFSVFEQADASTTRRHGGTGLGSLRLAALMGGTAGGGERALARQHLLVHRTPARGQ